MQPRPPSSRTAGSARAMGYLDRDGFLFIFDRLKDMVVSGGENVPGRGGTGFWRSCPGSPMSP